MKRHLFILLLLFSFITGCNHEIQTVQENLDDPSVNIEIDQNDNQNKNDVDQDQNIEKGSESLKQLSVHYLDVGQGDATLFTYSDHDKKYTILYDVGDWQGSEVVPYLQQENIEYLDVIIISHPHADHMGQLEQIMNHFEVGEVWMTGNTANTKIFESTIDAVLESDADYAEPRAGEVFDIGPLELFVLHPKNLTGQLNEDSLSILFTYGEVSFLFTGDAYRQEERLMIERADDLQADFLQLGHHGSNTSSDPRFVEVVNPSYAIYSAGADNSYGHPHKEIVQLFQEKEITLYGTDVHGTIIVETDGITYNVTTERKGKIEQEKSQVDSDDQETDIKTDECIDLNEASKEELMQITQIGQVRAEQLINLRPFTSVNELTKIKGIGDSRLEEIKQQGKACVGGK